MTDWPARTLGGVLALHADARPEQEALVIAGRRLTYRRLREETRRVAAGLLALGVRRGDHVAVCLGNGCEWITFFYAAASIGAVTVPVNTRFKAEELRYCLAQSDSTVLLTCDRFLRIDFLAMLREFLPAIDAALPADPLPRLRAMVVLGEDVPRAAIPYARFLEGGDERVLARAEAAVEASDVLLMQYTSGSTSFPKGVMLTHDNMLRNAHAISERIDLRPGDRYFSARPFFHVAGTTLSMLAALVRGSTLFSTPAFDPGEGLRTIAEERCDVTSGNDTMFLAMLNHPDFERYRPRFALRGGWASTGPEVTRQVMSRMGMRYVSQAYGLSEASPNVWMNAWDDPEQARIDGCAFPLEGLEVRIVDIDSGREQPPGTPGEIRVRGWSLMKGYYNKPEETARAIDAEGWLHTGDLGVCDAEGRFRFIGRAKEMLRVGGENVAPADVENVLHQNPKIRQAQVVGVPDARLQEVACAYVVLVEGAGATPQEIIDWCGQRMANFKVPRYVRIVEGFENIGMTGSAKVQKNKVRTQALIDFGLKENAS